MADAPPSHVSSSSGAVSMKSKLIPCLVVALGVLCLVSQLAADNCGANPVYNAPAKCKPAEADTPVEKTGTCIRNTCQICEGWACVDTTWGVAVPGRCESAIVTETSIPKCEDDYGVTIVEVMQWKSRCYTADICICVWDETGVTERVQVCTCRDMN